MAGTETNPGPISSSLSSLDPMASPHILIALGMQVQYYVNVNILFSWHSLHSESEQSFVIWGGGYGRISHRRLPLVSPRCPHSSLPLLFPVAASFTVLSFIFSARRARFNPLANHIFCTSYLVLYCRVLSLPLVNGCYLGFCRPPSTYT